MIEVPCGTCGRIRIVRENSITGQVTGDFTFDNIWTDAGLAYLSGYATKGVRFPSYMTWGQGVHPDPSSATGMVSLVGGAGAGYEGGAASRTVEGNTLIVSKTRSAVQGARGVDWELRELGLRLSSSGTLVTYALARDLAGNPVAIQVSSIEILTIYYTIQFHYPMSLPPVAVDVEGLPPTTATLTLISESGEWGGLTPAQFWGGSTSTYGIAAYADTSFSDKVNASHSGDNLVWGVGSLNRTTPVFGLKNNGNPHYWVLDPPITKMNTQVLEIAIYWGFTNVIPVEIE